MISLLIVLVAVFVAVKLYPRWKRFYKYQITYEEVPCKFNALVCPDCNYKSLGAAAKWCALSEGHKEVHLVPGCRGTYYLIDDNGDIL